LEGCLPACKNTSMAWNVTQNLRMGGECSMNGNGENLKFHAVLNTHWLNQNILLYRMFRIDESVKVNTQEDLWDCTQHAFSEMGTTPKYCRVYDGHECTLHWKQCCSFSAINVVVCDNCTLSNKVFVTVMLMLFLYDWFQALKTYCISTLQAAYAV
jgi:hypothetical protein